MDILDLLYPQVTCWCCGKKVYEDIWLCKECRAELERLRHKREVSGNLVQGHVLFAYEGMVSALVSEFKFHEKKYLGKFMAREIADCLSAIDIDFDVILPVPSHTVRRLKRGYNQTHLMVRELSIICKIPFDLQYLIREVQTPPLKKMNRMERFEVLENAFSIRKEKPYKTVLLIDDIYTTGATIDACGRVLYEHDCDQIVYIAFSGNY
jgi:ComF family protein